MKLKAKELHKMAHAELLSLCSEHKEKLFDIRLKSYKAQLKNVKEMKEIKKNIARILTVLKIKK